MNFDELLAKADSIDHSFRMILEIHSPMRGQCQQCYGQRGRGYPCATARLIIDRISRDGSTPKIGRSQTESTDQGESTALDN